MERKTIIIADDHQSYAEGIFRMLNNSDYRVVGYAADGFALLSLLNGFVPDVILLDINIPRMNGFESANKIKDVYPGIKIIMLTMYEEPEFYRLAVNNNFDGYLMKNAQSRELIEVIEKVLGSETVFSSINNNNSNDNECDQTQTLGEIDSLTAREREVLKLITLQMTMVEIAAKLYLSPITVNTYRKNLLRKLNQRNTVDLAIMALNNAIN